jgi:hypothetical protein
MIPVEEVPPVVVWGNCQAAPIAALLSEPLQAHGWGVRPVAPVFEIDATGLAEVHELMARAAVLVTQPIRDEYSIPGCGSAQLSAMMRSADARVVTIPVTYDSSAFPYQVNAHRGDGSRIDAPLTDYHDLRAIVAAERGLDVDAALEWWPAPTPEMVRTNAKASQAELQRRETELDVKASDLLDRPAMFTLSHPNNAVLAEIARRVLVVLGIDGDVEVPVREFLGARRAPVERAVVEALGWSDSAQQDDWIVEKRVVPLREVLETHLPWYAERPDIAVDARKRFRDRLNLLDL